MAPHRPSDSVLTPHTHDVATCGAQTCAIAPHWLLPSNDRQIDKERSGADLDDRPPFIQYVTEPGDCFGQIRLFLPARRRPPVNLSLERGRGLPFPGTRETWMAPFDSSESLFGCTHLVLLLETETVRNYRKRVRQCEALGEHALAEQLRAIPVQQQDHQMYR